MNIGVIGNGFVGNSVYQYLLLQKKYLEQIYKQVDINVFDIIEDKSTIKSLEDLVALDNYILFVCLPTPMIKEDGRCYTGFVEETLDKISSLVTKQQTVVLKSTMPPGTSDYFSDKYSNLKIVFYPEFLTEANAFEDFKAQKNIFLGVEKDQKDLVRNKQNTILLSFFQLLFPHADIQLNTYKEAEMLKYMTNAFLATKVIFANEMYRICNTFEIDYDRVLEKFLQDPRIGRTHLKVPGPDGDFGYGGHCFPKDVRALIAHSFDQGYNPLLLQIVNTLNLSWRTDKDWENMENRAVI